MKGNPYMNPTDEQLRAIKAADAGKSIVINACAGSGKTSVLVMLAQYTKRRGLCLMFNRANAMESRGRFPRTMGVSTWHSLAYGYMRVGTRFAHKLNPKPDRRINRAWTADEIVEFLGILKLANMSATSIAVAVKETVQRYQQSADEEISRDHVVMPQSITKLKDYLRQYYPATNTDDAIAAIKKRLEVSIVVWAQRLWQARIDRSSSVRMDHDTYLKLFSLERPCLNRRLILLDEAQDTNDCCLQIFLDQRERFGSQLVLVGDRRQAIYGWRGAINAMERVDYPQHQLTQSWRFGPAVAEIAEAILDYDLRVRGNPALNTQIVAQPDEPFTRLFRTNAALLDEAIPYIEQRAAIDLAIDLGAFTRKLSGAYWLWKDRPEAVSVEEIKAYGTWDTFVDAAEEDPEIKRIVKLILDRRETIPDLLEILKAYRRPENPSMIFSTAHRAKGLEWANVSLADDYKSPWNEKGEWVGLSVPEQNLLYVAATRGTHALEVNETVLDILDHHRDNETAEEVSR